MTWYHGRWSHVFIYQVLSIELHFIKFHVLESIFSSVKIYFDSIMFFDRSPSSKVFDECLSHTQEISTLKSLMWSFMSVCHQVDCYHLPRLMQKGADLQKSHKTNQSWILQDSGSSLLPFKCIDLYHQSKSGIKGVHLPQILTLPHTSSQGPNPLPKAGGEGNQCITALTNNQLCNSISRL